MTFTIIHNREAHKLDFNELRQDDLNACSKDNNEEYIIISFDLIPSFFDAINFEEYNGKKYFNNEEFITLLSTLDNFKTKP